MNQPFMRILAGPNGSGKSTLYSKLQERLGPERIGAWVNADEIEQSLKQNKLSLGLGTYQLECTHNDWELYCTSSYFRSWINKNEALQQQAKDITITDNYIKVQSITPYTAAIVAEFIRRLLLASQRSFTFETVMSDESKVKFIKEANDSGYKTYLYFICTEDVGANIERVALRTQQGGHDVPEEKIRDRYYKSLELMLSAIALCRRAYVFNSVNNDFKRVLEAKYNIDNDGMRYFCAYTDENNTPEWLTKYFYMKIELIKPPAP